MPIPKINNYKLPNRSTIYSDKKINWNVNPKKSVLLIHDMQNYFVNFYGDNEVIKQVIKNIISLKSLCKKVGIPVVYTVQPACQSEEERGLLKDFWGCGISDSIGAEIIDALTPDEDDIVLTKLRYSAFYESGLMEILNYEQRDTLIITGVYGHIGCTVTACDAFMNSIKAIVVGNGIADFSKYYHVKALNFVNERCGVIKYLEDLDKEIKIQIARSHNN